MSYKFIEIIAITRPSTLLCDPPLAGSCFNKMFYFSKLIEGFVGVKKLYKAMKRSGNIIARKAPLPQSFLLFRL